MAISAATSGVLLAQPRKRRGRACCDWEETSMHILITGAAGMVGRKLAGRLARDGVLADRPVERLSLLDVIEPPAPAGFTGTLHQAAIDLATPGVATSVLASRPDVIFHLAAIVSGEAETDLEKGYRVNFDGMRQLLEAVRLAGPPGAAWCPRFVFASSSAVFGGDLPAVIGDDYPLTPQTSYGTQKAMCELLLADYTRRGFLHGVGLRLPTICVRPGKPNRAASGFFSGIIREPLAGQPAALPVGRDVRHWMASPRSAVQFLLHAASLDPARLGSRPNLTMPGLSVTVGEQIAALERVAGAKAVALIQPRHDPLIDRIVRGWAQAFDPARARGLGFKAETSFEEIIQVYIDDELGGRLP
jgi:nucleoside-diphosphate-sugar epimerase